jgi:2-methylcitrate dehydratase
MYCRFSDIVDITPFDHSTLDCIASGIASAYLFGLPPDRMADALNLAITPNLALHQPRIDVLSHWKACAAANACRNAVFATMLAARGLTGPRLAFEGAEGYFAAAGKGQTALEPLGGQGRPYKIMECSMKRFPLGQYSQTVVQAALEVREKLPDVRDIAEVHIRTLQKAITIMAGDPQKWRPTTRETADHSMVYTTGVALMPSLSASQRTPRVTSRRPKKPSLNGTVSESTSFRQSNSIQSTRLLFGNEQSARRRCATRRDSAVPAQCQEWVVCWESEERPEFLRRLVESWDSDSKTSA